VIISRPRCRRGFTLLEALLALVLATLLFAGISLYTGTWLRQWERLVQRGTREDVVAIVLDRVVEDLEEAQPIYRQSPAGGSVMFAGDQQSVTFVRPALGFDERAGLDEVTYVKGSVGVEPAILRSRRTIDRDGNAQSGEDLPLIRGNYLIAFSYAGADGKQSETWSDTRRLPVLVQVSISGNDPRPWRQIAYARIRVEMPAVCGNPAKLAECRSRMGAGP